MLASWSPVNSAALPCANSTWRWNETVASLLLSTPARRGPDDPLGKHRARAKVIENSRDTALNSTVVKCHVDIMKAQIDFLCVFIRQQYLRDDGKQEIKRSTAKLTFDTSAECNKVSGASHLYKYNRNWNGHSVERIPSHITRLGI